MAQAKIGKPPSTKGAPPPRDERSRNLKMADSEETAQLNFTVPLSFKEDFKEYADKRGMKMVAVLYKAFAILRDEET